MAIKRIDTIIEGWDAYKLVDSGDGRRLEYFGDMLLDRPDPQALWKKGDSEAWQHAQAQFLWADKGDRWSVTQGIPDEWLIQWHDMRLSLSLKGFKHIGVFPEHCQQWSGLQELGNKHAGLRMLNLFGYTGAASIAAAQAGMKVTHVDASKQTMQTVKQNILQSGLPHDSLRTVTEDALLYAKRLVQRQEQFEVIVMDPPAFGRGPKGEVWKIEEKLPELLALLPQLLSPDAKLVILNGYAAGFSARTFAELLHEALPGGDIYYGEIALKQQINDRLLTTGIYASWQK